MVKIIYSTAVTLVIFSVCIHVQRDLSAQDSKESYRELYEKGQYQQALEIIKKQLDEIYSKRVDDKRVPTGFITMRAAAKEKNLKQLFRDRKAEHFFIEDNKEISQLHYYAANCYAKDSDYNNSLNHYIQCLRFKKVEKDDSVIYYEIAQLFKKADYREAYLNTLDTAVSLDPENYGYSLELGKALYRTGKKKLAIHHLQRYIDAAESEVSPEIYLMLGNLYEDTAKYLETEKYYREYLKKKPDDGHIHFALAYISLKRTGNYPLARSSLDKALELLPEDDLYRRCKSYEYKADIAYQDMEFQKAVEYYRETIGFQDKVSDRMKSKQAEIDEVSAQINDLKSSLLKEQDFENYTLYESLLDKKGLLEMELESIKNEYKKLNSGRVRWYTADCLERMEQYNDAISFYREAIRLDYNANKARDKIIKLQLKIKRGY